MPIRLLAIDLDGTLLDSRSEISPGNQEALAAAAARGVQVVVVTGRRFHSARPYVEKIPFPVTLICSNGAFIASLSGEVFYRDFLPRAVAVEALAVGRDYRPYAAAIFDLPARGQIVMENCAVTDGPLGWYLRTAPDFLAQVPDLETAIEKNPVQVLFGGPPATLEPLEAVLRDSPVGDRVHLTWTKYLTRDVSILDVMNRGCTKGRALKFWSERCGIQSAEVMAIGDNYNDVEMLEFAGQPVVMGNHAPGFGRDGWPVTRSNDEDGVAAAVESYVLR